MDTLVYYARNLAKGLLPQDKGKVPVQIVQSGEEEGEGRLFAVSPEVQGQGISRSHMVQAMEWFLSRGARRMIISTQITNIGVQKVWVRLGLEPAYAYHTFHKWFDQS